MKARDESGINKDFPEKSTDWIATAVKRCTDVVAASVIAVDSGRQGSNTGLLLARVV